MKKQVIFIPHLHKDPETEAEAIAILCENSYIGKDKHPHCVHYLPDFNPVKHCPFCGLFKQRGDNKK